MSVKANGHPIVLAHRLRRTATDAVEIVGVAAEVKSDIAGNLGNFPANLRKSVKPLKGIGVILSRDT